MIKRMSIPYDDVKDKALIDWLNTKTNKAGFIREILYNRLQQEQGHIPRAMTKEEPKQEHISKAMKNLEKFKRG